MSDLAGLITAIDYALFPPEFNSARIHGGPGSGPMMSAAAAWRSLAAELLTAAESYETIITRLSGEEWLGPGSAAMAAAAKPYVTWMQTTAAQAEHAATQASSAAASFEIARAASAHPTEVTTNRATLSALVATNVLGINTAAIAATEAHYFEMWARDAAAMYAYAASSASAAKVVPFQQAPQTTRPDGTAQQGAAVANAAASGAANSSDIVQAITNLPNILQGLASPLASTAAAPAAGGSGLLEAILNSASMNGFVFLAMQPMMSGINSAATAAAYIPSTLLPNMIGYFAGGGFNAVGGGTVGSGLGALLAPGGPLSSLGALGGGLGASVSSVSAGVGQASLVGSSLSVPPGWAGATPAASAGAGTGAIKASSWAAAPEANAMSTMPPGMVGAPGQRGSFGYGTPRYGFKPTVMPRPVIAG